MAINLTIKHPDTREPRPITDVGLESVGTKKVIKFIQGTEIERDIDMVIIRTDPVTGYESKLVLYEVVGKFQNSLRKKQGKLIKIFMSGAR